MEAKKLPRIDPRTGKQLPKSTGRPRRPIPKGSKFNPEAAAKILVLVRGGNYPDTAASFAGVALSSFRDWLKDGIRGRTDELEKFVLDLAQAEAQAQVQAVEQVRRSPKDAFKFLSRRFNSNWGPKSQVSVLGADGGPVVINLKWTETGGRA